MAALELHPREAIPNTTALARADALFAQLTGQQREYLGEAIAAFRLPLERQDPDEIAHLRGQLNALVQAFRGHQVETHPPAARDPPSGPSAPSGGGPARPVHWLPAMERTWKLTVVKSLLFVATVFASSYASVALAGQL